jgi:heat shock protein HslJ
MRAPSTLALVALALISQARITPARAQAPTTIEGVSWRLAKLSKLDDAELDQSPRAIVRFDNARLRGFSGCNRFTGSYTLAGDRVDVGHQTHTVNKCAQPAADVEDLMKLAFKAPVRFKVQEGRLTLHSENGIVMTFEAQPAHALEGVEWEITQLSDGKGAMVAPAKGSTISFSFRSDGAVVGNAGCNLFRASYQRDGERLTVDPPVSTRKACREPGVMEREQALLAALHAVGSWTLRGELLDLLSADGQRVLMAERPAG